MYWQLLDNEKNIQCSEPVVTLMKENHTRDASAASLTRTMSMYIFYLKIVSFNLLFY